MKIKKDPKAASLSIKNAPKGDALATIPQFDPSGPSSPFAPVGVNARKEKMVVKSLSPIIDPKKWPVDADGKALELYGRFTKMFKTREFEREGGTGKGKKEITKIIGTGMEIFPDGASGGVALPVTAVLRRALEITGDGEEADSPYLGQNVLIWLDKGNPLPSRQGQAAHNFKVAVSEKVVS